MIGKTDQANHQYDLTDFWAAVDAGSMPAVSFLKAPAYQDGHAGYSDAARRAAVPRRHDQPARRARGLERHGGRHPLRRLRRVVRPPDGPDRQPVPGPGARRADRHELRYQAGHIARRLPGPLRLRSPAAAARDLAVRESRTSSTTASPTRPPSCASSRTTGRPAGSATTRSTPRQARWSACSTSPIAAADRASCFSTLSPERHGQTALRNGRIQATKRPRDQNDRPGPSAAEGRRRRAGSRQVDRAGGARRAVPRLPCPLTLSRPRNSQTARANQDRGAARSSEAAIATVRSIRPRSTQPPEPSRAHSPLA